MKSQLSLFEKSKALSVEPASSAVSEIIVEALPAPEISLPIHHHAIATIDELPQRDSPLRAKHLESQRSLFAFPFFALSWSKNREAFSYSDEHGNSITIKPSHAGAATMKDKDLIIYAISLILGKINRQEPTSPTVTFTPNDFFRACGRDRSGSTYKAIIEMLERLQGTVIFTNIETLESGTTTSFAWVQSTTTHYIPNQAGRKKVQTISITLPDWLYRQVIKQRSKLAYDERYWSLTMLQRRLYEIAKAKCLNRETDSFPIGLGKLYKQVGASCSLRRFKYEVAQIVKLNDDKDRCLPEFAVYIQGDPRDPRTKALAADGYPVAARHMSTIMVYFERRVKRKGASGWVKEQLN